MKVWWNILIVAVILQLSLAVPAPVPQNDALTVAEKRYKFFDTVVSFTLKITRSQLFRMTDKHSLILNDYREWWKAHKDNVEYNKEQYEALISDLEVVLGDLENLKTDADNCELQRKVQDEYFTMEKRRVHLKNSELNRVWLKVENHEKIVSATELDSSISVFLEPLADAIRELLRNLSEDDKMENEPLLKWCQEFLQASNMKSKLITFQDVALLLGDELELETKDENPNCKLKAQIEWINHMSRAAMAYGIWQLYG